VYSAGVGEDVSFDLELIARTGCQVWAFDPTPRAIEYAHGIREERFHFLPVGISSTDGSRRFFAPADTAHVSHSILGGNGGGEFFEAECKTVETLMRELGHEHVDLLKIDIEGAEYEVLHSMTTRPAYMLVELHPLIPLARIVEMVRKLPYEVLHVEGWDVMLAHADRP
jgi:FkbM family methyltransferase